MGLVSLTKEAAQICWPPAAGLGISSRFKREFCATQHALDQEVGSRPGSRAHCSMSAVRQQTEEEKMGMICDIGNKGHWLAREMCSARSAGQRVGDMLTFELCLAFV